MRSAIDAFVVLETAAREMGLDINAGKTKTSTNKTFDLSPLKIRAWTFETVKQFNYLGILSSCCNNLDFKINNRIFMANSNLFKSKFISVNIKLSRCKTLIRPVVLYGSEFWTSNETQEGKVVIYERKILRKIFGPIQENNAWRILYNYEIRKKKKKIITDMVGPTLWEL